MTWRRAPGSSGPRPPLPAGTRRYERVRSLVSGYRGTRFYLFPGGCVTYDFNFSTRGQALVNEVSLALGFVTRSQVSQLEGRAV